MEIDYALLFFSQTFQTAVTVKNLLPTNAWELLNWLNDK